MNQGLSELVSKVRMELFTISREINYLQGAFRYFNLAYGQLTAEKEKTGNLAGRLATKQVLVNRQGEEVNQLFEQVYTALSANEAVAGNASADFMLFYAIGWEVKYELGMLDSSNKTLFFNKLIERYNYEFKSEFSLLEDIAILNNVRVE